MGERADLGRGDEDLEVLASYLDESETLEAGSPELEALRSRYLKDHPQARKMLQEHFEGEERLRSSLGPERPAVPKLERYTEVELLGCGGMGIVYKAFDQTLKRWVAIKLCASAAMSEPERQRFRLEAESMAAMKHPNIVKVFDVREYEGSPYLTMELIKGGSLDEHLDRFRGDDRALARLMIEVARGVHHAHQRQILHRDLKPSNILLHPEADGSLRAHVMDFGLAKPLEGIDTNGATGAWPGEITLAYGKLVGTANYMSPEQALGQPATTQSDVYGLGTVMYALLTGKAPFQGQSVEDTLEQVRDAGVLPEPPSAFNPDVDPTLEAICRKCLEYEPANRYASAEGLAVDLERWLARQPTRARPLSLRSQLGLWARRNPLGLALIVLAGVILALVGRAVYDEMQQTEATLANVASTHADSVRNWLRRQRELVSAWAADERVGELIARSDSGALQQLVLKWEDDTDDGVHASAYQSIFVVDGATGSLLARSPYLDPSDEGYNFLERDYYRGAVELAGEEGGSPAYRSRVYYSLSDSLYKFAISAAVRHEGKIVGVVAASVTTSADLSGLLPISEDRQSAFVLLAVRDSKQIQGDSDRRPAGAGNLLTLAHPLLGVGEEPFWLDAPYEQTFLARRCLRNYRDPSASTRTEFSGPWVACWAPVAGSGPEPEFYVVYQQRASGLSPAVWIGTAILLIGILSGLALQYLRRRARDRD